METAIAILTGSIRYSLAAVVMAAAVLAPAEARAEVHTQEGVVVSAAMNKLVMSDLEGKQHTHAIEETTKITVHGKPARLDDLKLGMRIRVMSDEKKVLAVATVDEVKSDPESRSGLPSRSRVSD
jgi:hypothetical protein